MEREGGKEGEDIGRFEGSTLESLYLAVSVTIPASGLDCPCVIDLSSDLW